MPTGATKARSLIESITAMWHELDHPCSERAVDHAIARAERRVTSLDDERAVLLHGDVHEWNAIEGVNEFKLDLRPGDEQARARWLASRTGLDATTIWEWGVVERVSTGLLCTQVDLQPVGREMLAVADRIAEQLKVNGPRGGMRGPG